MKQRLVLAAYRLGWAALRRAPERLGSAVFVVIADVGWWRHGKGVRRLEHNLSRVVGPVGLRALSRRGMRSYFRYWYELFRLPVLSDADLAARTTVVGFDTISAVRAEGRGVILALPHMGNWDQAGAWLVGHGVPFTTVAERLEPAELFDRFVAFRESLGMEVLALTGSAQSPYAILRERLRGGGVICLLADRDLTTSGVEVDFFGETARMPAGPAALALATGAALLPVTLTFPAPRQWQLTVHDEVRAPADARRTEKVSALTQGLADVFAGAIAEAPQDWHMLQRLWVADLDKRVEAA
ncbi:phosphatidylinositol mannoside acyltransferase [Acidothermaceae bacterium B102]|nr:phosphatidylinositol mannoside acyltransferase [Acidothermaceae bacterium B102]